MLVVEVVDGTFKLVQRETLSFEDIQEFVQGPIEGASLSADPRAQSVIAYFNADCYTRQELRENCFINRRRIWGNLLIVGVGSGGNGRGLTTREINCLQLLNTPRSPLPTVGFLADKLEEDFFG